MKKYLTPELEITDLDELDIVTTSGSSEFNSQFGPNEQEGNESFPGDS